jgi:hypothetical protein
MRKNFKAGEEVYLESIDTKIGMEVDRVEVIKISRK